MVVKEVMTSNPVSADADASIGDVINQLFELDVRHLPIVDEGELVGIVSDRDVRAYLTPSLSELSDVGEAAQQLGRAVSTVMNSNLITVHPESDLSEVVDLMLDHKVGALPVVSPESRELVGIVSYMDILKAAQDNL